MTSVRPKIYIWIIATVLFGLGAGFAIVYFRAAKSGNSDSWDVLDRMNEQDPVAMFIHGTSHYDLLSEEGTREFEKLVPASGHIIHLPDGPGKPQRPYTVALFHQMQCLNILRKAYNSPGSEPLTYHCLTYLRQTILCRPNLRLESVHTPSGMATQGYDAVCPRDWTLIYEAAERYSGTYVPYG